MTPLADSNKVCPAYASRPVDALAVAAASEAVGGFSAVARGKSSTGRAIKERAEPLGLTGLLLGIFLVTVAAYYGIIFLGGSDFDYLHIPLPGVSSAKHDRAASGSPGGFKGPSVPKVDPFVRPASLNKSVRESTAAGQADDPRPLSEIFAGARPLSEQTDNNAQETQVASTNPPSGPFPSYGSQDLAQALEAVDACIGCRTCRSTGLVARKESVMAVDGRGDPAVRDVARNAVCPDCRGRPNTRLNQEAYQKLCRLAEVATWLTPDPAYGDPAIQKEAVRRTMLRVAGDRPKCDSLGRLAGHWVQRPDRNQSGVLLAGTVQSIEPQGAYWSTRLILFGLSKEVVVLSATAASLAPRDRVLVAGTIIDRPASSLPDYSGPEGPIVWGGLPLVLPEGPR